MGCRLDLKRAFLILCITFWCLVSLPAASRWSFLPKKPIFPAPLADQNFPRFSLLFPLYTLEQIDTLEDGQVPSLREFLEFGGVQSLIRYTPNVLKTCEIELSVGAGVITLFDSFEDNLNNFGWEGSGFLTVNVALSPQLVFRFGFHHLSSHVGDEYLAYYDVLHLPVTASEDIATGRTYSMNYVRDSLMGGLSLQLSQIGRVYAELRYSMWMLRYMFCYNAFPWQANIGLEFQWPVPDQHSHRWYIAAHVSGYQESSWFPSSSIQFGRIFSPPNTSKRARIGMELFHGRAQIAVFNHTHASEPTAWDQLQIEQYVAIGIWYDF